MSTTENFDAYETIKEKAGLADFLQEHEIQVPQQFIIDEVEDGKAYFVKLRYGSDSFGIVIPNIRKSKDKVKNQLDRLQMLGHESIIEVFIEGKDCTVTCSCPQRVNR